jgi:hypothetical protein
LPACSWQATSNHPPVFRGRRGHHQFDGLPHPPGSKPAVPGTPASSPARQINSSERHRWRSIAQ